MKKLFWLVAAIVLSLITQTPALSQQAQLDLLATSAVDADGDEDINLTSVAGEWSNGRWEEGSYSGGVVLVVYPDRRQALVVFDTPSGSVRGLSRVRTSDGGQTIVLENSRTHTKLVRTIEEDGVIVLRGEYRYLVTGQVGNIDLRRR